MRDSLSLLFLDFSRQDLFAAEEEHKSFLPYIFQKITLIWPTRTFCTCQCSGENEPLAHLGQNHLSISPTDGLALWHINFDWDIPSLWQNKQVLRQALSQYFF